MKRVLLTLKFDGSGFYGWQAQANGNTVQQTLQDAVQSVFGARPGISGCGRTDSGVHALGYRCHLDICGEFECERLIRAVNSYFISREIKIAVTEACEVESDFHSRYYIKSKEYIYKIQTGKYKDPFYFGRALYYHKPLDLTKMREAAGYITGKKNFAAFMADGSDIPAGEAVRDILRIDLTCTENIVRISMEADGFLYKMARIIAGTLLEVSEGRINSKDLPDIIVSRDRKRAGRTLPPHGLYLNRIEYMTKPEYTEKIKNYTGKNKK
ncbi:MAG: tRNA pseudouridine(38-40) synthase TruA [Oscillospiraceae bacterium]|nr:tRNA pseudouridine(38-40) synthase TruA [Oscillospiraceae bacterium]